MTKMRSLMIGLCASSAVTLCSLSARAATDCSFSTRGHVLRLQADCSTDATLLVPNGFALDGRHFTISAVDPPGAHFLGAVIRNAGSSAEVRNLSITVSNLAEVCDAGDDALRGIEFDGASGSISGNAVRGLNQANGQSGCQEGIGIDVRNSGSAETHVSIEDNQLDAYQKTGILLFGSVQAGVRANRVAGFGPTGVIAQNGIQLSAGARASVEFNVVSGNSYTGTAGGVVATGILVTGGPTLFTSGIRIEHNVLLENDVAVALNNAADAQSDAPATPTDIRVIRNAIFKSALTNGSGVQIGISDVGNADRIVENTIAGPGYDPAGGARVERIFADAPFSVNAVIRRNRFLP